jgi:CRP-like cAMP-binding protein
MSETTTSATSRPTSKNHPETLLSGQRTDASGHRVSNVILLSLPDNEYDLIRPHLEFVPLVHHRALHEQGQKLQFGYFVNAGMVSLLITTDVGKSVEIGIVGREGFVGVPIAVAIDRSAYQSVVQIPGDGLRIKAEDLQGVLRDTPKLVLLLNRYAQVRGMQVAQLAACNRLHEIEQRLARWLLMAQDRMGAGTLPMTHDFLAQMLGTGRPSVSVAAGILQQAGMIEYSRGFVRIVNRKSLESAACECYGVIQHFNSVVGLS